MRDGSKDMDDLKRALVAAMEIKPERHHFYDKDHAQPVRLMNMTEVNVSDSKNSPSLAVVTVSDTRTEESDKSGGVLVGCLEEAGHKLHSKQIVKDDVYQLRAEVSRLIADPGVKGV